MIVGSLSDTTLHIGSMPQVDEFGRTKCIVFRDRMEDALTQFQNSGRHHEPSVKTLHATDDVEAVKWFDEDFARTAPF